MLKIPSIRQKNRIKGLISYELPLIFGLIISKHLATLKEIKTAYNYTECLELLDIIMVDNYNDYLINESSNNG